LPSPHSSNMIRVTNSSYGDEIISSLGEKVNRMAQVLEFGTNDIVAGDAAIAIGDTLDVPVHDSVVVPEHLRGTIDALLVLMPVLTRRINSLATECPSGYKPTLPQIRVMTVLAAGGTSTVSAIAEALESSRPATSEMIDRMVDIGYVSREPNPADRRQVLISLTPPAAEIMDVKIARRRAVLVESLSDLSEQELAGFLKGMRGFTRTIAPDVMSDPAVASVCERTVAEST